ncbi:unnamed protein product [Vicia faba]|uniref:Reverse transcriptase zinc-binding domain-containing protein n=1 Tax=Vicia faba TaxID=3906 RepID=A0AAV1A4E3_VICFA|nr:unnamed protein product [Vicia faba]
MISLLKILSHKSDYPDVVESIPDGLEGYTVQSSFKLIFADRRFKELKEGSEAAFNILWKTQVSFKVKALGWRIFINMIATKDQLRKRGNEGSTWKRSLNWTSILKKKKIKDGKEGIMWYNVVGSYQVCVCGNSEMMSCSKIRFVMFQI